MKAPDPLHTLQELLPLLREFALGQYGIALGGAHAKGIEDAESDIDLYVFCEAVRPSAARTELARSFSPRITEIRSWENAVYFDQAGTDFHWDGRRVECWMRNSHHIDATILECQRGDITQELVTWTPNGFFNHCCLSDIRAIQIVDDAYGILSRWKNAVAEYPPVLAKAIIRRHLTDARFWPDNFHYKSAIRRVDIIYTTSIVQQVVHNLIQVVFALNRQYFPGDKKLAEHLDKLERQPVRFVERVHTLVFPSAPPTVGLLERQRESLVALLQDVEQLYRLEACQE
jgi:hypothetical protein